MDASAAYLKKHQVWPVPHREQGVGVRAIALLVGIGLGRVRLIPALERHTMDA